MINFKKNKDILADIKEKALESLLQAGLDVHADLVNSATIPKASGMLQNQATQVDASDLSKGKISIISDTAYARRKYFEPGLSFDKSINKRAGGRWFADYINGNKQSIWGRQFAKHLRQKIR